MEPLLHGGERRRHVVAARHLQDRCHVLFAHLLRLCVSELERQVLLDVRALLIVCNKCESSFAHEYIKCCKQNELENVPISQSQKLLTLLGQQLRWNFGRNGREN